MRTNTSHVNGITVMPLPVKAHLCAEIAFTGNANTCESDFCAEVRHVSCYCLEAKMGSMKSNTYKKLNETRHKKRTQTQLRSGEMLLSVISSSSRHVTSQLAAEPCQASAYLCLQCTRVLCNEPQPQPQEQEQKQQKQQQQHQQHLLCNAFASAIGLCAAQR
ncbi:unnamed protein product [Polarella glacialis]|uniref:Uncharacterized protein n=1 Tax=Polarella glacialis TaxID=89957 RepID=A0A813ERM3_POLGL|nr:unnamed protein product [Polarella glacialis]